MSDTPVMRPWSARRPQSIVLSVAMVAMVVALEFTAVYDIRHGIGAAVPFFILVCAPVIGGYYLWYWNFYSFGAGSNDQ